MPLYVDDEDIHAQFTNKDVIHALRVIKAAAWTTAITPALALRLIRRHLRPLTNGEARIAFDKKRKTTWNSIHFLYAGIGFHSKNNDDLWQVARAVSLVHSHTTQPPRDLEFAPIEVNTFFQTCGYLRMPMEELRYPAKRRDIDPLRFCTLCWRQPLPGRKLCGYHAPSGPERFADDARNAAARYKAGIRQKELFEKTVNRILTRESIEFHESLFTAPMLFPERDIASWLAERRPEVWRKLGDRQYELNDENTVKILLDTIHSSNALSLKTKALYKIVNEHIQAHPALIWPMLVRAEGWYQSRHFLEENRGGKRPGAGSRSKLDSVVSQVNSDSTT